MKNKSVFDKMFQSKRFNIALSLLLALITWYIVSIYINPERTVTVHDIPVDFTYNAATYESQGLEILQNNQVYVTMEITGDGIVVNSLSAEDFTVYPAYTQVRGPGTYELSLGWKPKKTTTRNYEVKGPSPSSISVQFDKVADKKMPITINHSHIDIDPGYFLDVPVAAPAEVTLHGPETELNRVAKVVANVSFTGSLRESKITTEKLELQDKDGNVISLTESHITMDTEQAEVRLSVLEEREVPMKVEYINVPQGFNTDILHMKLSEETLRVAGPANLWDTLETFMVGHIDLSTFELGKEITFPIKLPDGFVNRDNLLSITATFDTEIENLEMKTINVSQISVVGSPPKGYKLKIPDGTRINNVQVIGPKDVLETLTSDNLIAQVYQPDLSLVSGSQTINVRILVPGFSNVFATGSYNLIGETITE